MNRKISRLSTQLFLIACLSFALAVAGAQSLPPAKLPAQRWKSYWMANPDISGNEHSVTYFRKQLELPAKPSRFWVAISGDNKYTLYVNERKVHFGPQLSNVEHWRYDTLNLAPYLKAGNNVVAVEVVHFGPDRFFGQLSHRSAFMMQGLDSDLEGGYLNAVNSDPGNGWLSTRNMGIFEKPVKWRVAPHEKDIIGGLYAVNPCDSIVAEHYNWDWFRANTSIATWKPARYVENAVSIGTSFGWLLEPRNTPHQKQTVQRLPALLKSEGATADSGFLQGSKPVTIPANSRALLWLDNKVLTIGYPALSFTKGNRARIRIGFAENLFEMNSDAKGNRNEWRGKRFQGITDVVVTDGRPHTWQPTWLRNFRFVQIEVITQDEPLVLQDFYNEYTSTSVPVTAQFRSANEQHNRVFDICRRTLELCTQDYYLSDSYYETIQYIADTKVHSTAWQELSGNYAHTRNALQQFHYSRLWDGNLAAAYPERTTIVIPNYSIIWVDMLYDYFRQTGDTAFLHQFKGGICHTMQMFEDLMTKDSLNGPTRWWYFVDWYAKDDWKESAPGGTGDQSAVITLHYVYALQHASALMDALGSPDDAARYRLRADELNRRVRQLCFVEKRGLFAQKADKARFDQHTNIMAILTGAAREDEYGTMLEKIMADTSLLQATLYYRFYLWEAIIKAKAVHLFAQALQPWEATLKDGVTTTIERFSTSVQQVRSDCHPWSTSPIYAFYRLLAGIAYGPPGSSTLTMQPSLQGTDWIEGVYPHPGGAIGFRFERKGNRLQGYVEVPEGLSITLKANGKTQLLLPGRNNVE